MIDENNVFLNVRQQQIVSRVALGMSNQEIADEMEIGVDSVKSSLREVYKKLRSNSRLELALWWMKNGRVVPIGATGSPMVLAPPPPPELFIPSHAVMSFVMRKRDMLRAENPAFGSSEYFERMGKRKLLDELIAHMTKTSEGSN